MASGGTHHHIIPFKTYLQILMVLLVLTVVTVAAAQVNFGAFNTVIAIAIASVKAGLVLSIFMHLKYDDKIYFVAFGCAVFGLVLLWIICWLDFITRFTPAALS